MHTYNVQFLSRRRQKWLGDIYLPGQPLKIDPSNQIHLEFIRNPDAVEISFAEVEKPKGKVKK